MQRYRPMVQRWLFIGYFFLLVAPVRVYTLWRSKQNHHLRAFQKALFDWFNGNLGYQNLSDL
jgi:hypothetical protein